MFGEYGYMEEGHLGKPYNLRLLKRLAPYGRPYWRFISAALGLTILITLLELAFPYFSKIAIDRYILSSWTRVDPSPLTDSEAERFLNRYGRFLETSRDGSVMIVSNRYLNKLDPADLLRYRSSRVLTSERYYRTQTPPQQAVGPGVAVFQRMEDGSFLIPYERARELPRPEILRVRAEDLEGLALIGAVFLLFLACSFGLSYAEYYLLEYTGQHIMQDIRLRLFKKMQGQALAFFVRHPIGRLVTRVTNDIENLNEMFKSVIITVFKDLFLLIGILAVLLYLNWRMALVSFILLPFVFGLTLLFSTLAREAFRELRATVAKINTFLQERLSGIRIIQLFTREAEQMAAFSRLNHENYLAGMKQIRVFAVFMPVMELISSAAVALLIWYGGGRVIQEQLTLGSLVAFIGYIQMFFKPIRDISEKYNIMQSAMASTERILEFMDHREEIQEAENPIVPAAMKGHLRFDGVSFAYEEGHPVLHDISFEVNPGETVAIVGATGSGKTTLINLVERFYDPDKGHIFLDGTDLKIWSKSRLRENMSLCMQDVFIFAGSLEENITLGRSWIHAAAMEGAAEKANALPFIGRLSHGFLQEVGEGGITLSVGERQLLSFARALAGEPRLLILDEATSSVDPETEHLIQEAISRMTAQRTTLVVAHRLSTIRDADRILVMHHGRIVEQGTHEALMALGGIYFKLNRLREA
jgi:ABC-type multidrug transport system fused ATPase/permease subunit